MKENSIEELQERLETLHVTQDARLACNADDLDIREEIAEVEEEIKELQDDTNADRENSIKNERSSIEEDIKIALDKFSDNRDIDSAMLIVEKFILGNYILLGGNRGNIVKDSLRYLLSDYKRILKENEILKEEKEQAWEEWNNLEQGSYKIEQKLKQQIKKLQKENEELNVKILSNAGIYQLGFRDGEKTYIQKVKDKIEELKKDKDSKYYYMFLEKRDIENTIKVLKEILKEVKKDGNGDNV